ncbi:MAG: hypothetical protein JO166_21995 [Deltaproteobacteria bacterium]|nr:hypothetical protein [Deltaproteobacteria bacterium]
MTLIPAEEIGDSLCDAGGRKREVLERESEVYTRRCRFPGARAFCGLKGNGLALLAA